MAIKVSKSVLWRAIRLQCIECMGNQQSLVDGCTCPKCSLYPFRSGNPSKAEVTEDMKPKRTERAFPLHFKRSAAQV
jgi:hypothetical protein